MTDEQETNHAFALRLHDGAQPPSHSTPSSPNKPLDRLGEWGDY